MIDGRWRRALAAALSAVFLAGSGGEVYGLHDCPHHHSGPAAPAPSPSGGAADRPAPETAPLQPESHETCTCIGTCHGGATVPATALDRGTPVVVAGPTRRVPPGAAPESAPPRDVAVLLPYPTGPPASAS